MSHYRKAMYRCGGNECDRVHMTDGSGVGETPSSRAIGGCAEREIACVCNCDAAGHD